MKLIEQKIRLRKVNDIQRYERETANSATNTRGSSKGSVLKLEKRERIARTFFQFKLPATSYSLYLNLFHIFNSVGNNILYPFQQLGFPTKFAYSKTIFFNQKNVGLFVYKTIGLYAKFDLYSKQQFFKKSMFCLYSKQWLFTKLMFVYIFCLYSKQCLFT